MLTANVGGSLACILGVPARGAPVDHREPQDPATDDPFLAFASAAYVAEAEPELEASTAAWLEEQAARPLIQAVAERSFAFMALEPGDAVLDVGCGVGVLLPALAAAVGPGGRVVGLDHSVGLLRRAQRRIDEAGLGSEVRLAHGDALRLPFPDATFDVAHIERVLMHLDEPDAAIRELRRVTRPGGRVLCAEVFPNGVEYDASDREVLFHVGAALLARFRRPSIGIELRRRLIGAGLEDVRVAGVVDVETQARPGRARRAAGSRPRARRPRDDRPHTPRCRARGASRGAIRKAPMPGWQ